MNIEEEIKQIAQRIKNERKKQDISQVKLSMSAGISINQLYIIEKGTRSPSLRTLLKICKALKVKPATLFTDVCSK